MTYNEFIQNIIDTRGQWNIPKGEYYENHHIIPQCLGGLPEKYNHDTIHENLIWLYPQEHYEAHKLLFKENPTNSSLALAWHNFHQRKASKNCNDIQLITGEEYAEFKLLYINASKSEETRNKISNSMKELWLDPIYKETQSKKISEGQKKAYRSGSMVSHTKGKPAWNSGLTKDEDERLKSAGEKSSKTKKEAFRSGKYEPWNKGGKPLNDKEVIDYYLTHTRSETIKYFHVHFKPRITDILDRNSIPYEYKSRK